MPTPTPTQRISPMLWFDDQAEQAAGFYTSIFLQELQDLEHDPVLQGGGAGGWPPGGLGDDGGVPAIRAATVEAAALLARKDLGVIAVGAAADFVVVAGDPLKDPALLTHPALVLKAGRQP
jgi:hypothetical protein